VSGDLKVKIKDIINEGPGFFKSYAKGLLPKELTDVLNTPVRGDVSPELSKATLQKKSDQMFAPGGEKDWGTDAPEKGPDASDEEEENKSVTANPSTLSPLHPDVSIMQAYPLVMQLKGKRYEMDEFGNFHPFGTTKPVTPAVQAFLSKERGKL
jgi:hypothetical protein